MKCVNEWFNISYKINKQVIKTPRKASITQTLAGLKKNNKQLIGTVYIN